MKEQTYGIAGWWEDGSLMVERGKPDPVGAGEGFFRQQCLTFPALPERFSDGRIENKLGFSQTEAERGNRETSSIAFILRPEGRQK